MLLQQVEQAYELQGEAEKDADKALSHLEDFINEQEQLVSVCSGCVDLTRFNKI